MTEKLPIPIVDTIQKRRSVRTFDGRALTPEDRKTLEAYFGNCPIPLGRMCGSILWTGKGTQREKNWVPMV